jgi:hypothetical protein
VHVWMCCMHLQQRPARALCACLFLPHAFATAASRSPLRTPGFAECICESGHSEPFLNRESTIYLHGKCAEPISLEVRHPCRHPYHTVVLLTIEPRVYEFVGEIPGYRKAILGIFPTKIDSSGLNSSEAKVCIQSP